MSNSKKKFVTWRPLTFASVVIVGIAFAIIKITPTSDFVFLPNKAQLVAPLIIVPEEKDPPESGGIYMVDIRVKRATIFDKLLPGLNDEATVIDGNRINPEGISDKQREQRSTLQMATSQEISAAVALQALGYSVSADLAGVLIDLVQSDSPAQGILQPGDIIVDVQGVGLNTPADLNSVMDKIKPLVTITLQIQRSQKNRTVRIQTFARDDDPTRALIGVRVRQAAKINIPIDIQIDTENIGGPSAGLAFALDIFDELGSCDLDAKRIIVVTGELALDGSVGAVGGIKQKAITARKLKADLFIVPTRNEEVARENAGKVRTIAVATFTEALEAITGKSSSTLKCKKTTI